MSLIGSLEDLGLGDILQIISLSQKSGVLVIRCDQGEGRIVFRQGLVRGAGVAGGPEDLRGVLVSGGFLAAEDYEAALSESGARDIPIEAALAARGSLSAERIDSLRREAVEGAVVEMFRWTSGEFSFDVRDESEPGDPPLLLPTGINAQYLAMEGLRVEDERDAHEGRPAAAPEHETELSVVLVEGEGGQHEPVALATQDEADGQPIRERQVVSEPPAAARSLAKPAEPAEPAVPPVVVVDAELTVLEWMKRALEDHYPRVHIFQRFELAQNRLRQYLSRATMPVVLVSPDVAADRMGGIDGATQFVRRLKELAPQACVAWLADSPPEGEGVAVPRPSSREIRDPNCAAELRDLEARLVAKLRNLLEETRASARASPPETGPAEAAEDLQRLREAIAFLSDASSRGEVLPEVIRFARETFSRVAMFMVVDDLVIGMAQSGLDSAGGPGDAELQRVTLDCAGSSWLELLMEQRVPLRAPPRDEGDRALVGILGDAAPSEAYLAPIESGGRMVAVLYGDNLPSGALIGETSALEVVLHHAGLALERSALQRELDELDAKQRETSAGGGS